MDKTSDIRQSRRNAQLNQRARARGWDSWYAYATAVKNDVVSIPANPQKKVTTLNKKR